MEHVKTLGKPCKRQTYGSKRGAIFSHAMWRRPRREPTLTQNGRCRPYLAGQDVSEGRECVVEGLVINGLVQILDKDVANAALSEGRVTLRPHDAERSAFNHVEVHRVQGSLSYKHNTNNSVTKVQGLNIYSNHSVEIRDSLTRDVARFTLVRVQNGVTWRLKCSY